MLTAKRMSWPLNRPPIPAPVGEPLQARPTRGTLKRQNETTLMTLFQNRSLSTAYTVPSVCQITDIYKKDPKDGAFLASLPTAPSSYSCVLVREKGIYCLSWTGSKSPRVLTQSITMPSPRMSRFASQRQATWAVRWCSNSLTQRKPKSSCNG